MVSVAEIAAVVRETRSSQAVHVGTEMPRQLVLGSAVHRAIGVIASLPNRQDFIRDPAAVAALSQACVGDWPTVRRQRGTARQVAAYVHLYGARFMPPGNWRFLGCEVRISDSQRVDVLWQKRRSGDVIADEAKVDAYANPRERRTEWEQQARRYLQALQSTFGKSVLGIRVLTLNTPRRSMFLDALGTRMLLWETPYCAESGWRASGSRSR